MSDLFFEEAEVAGADEAGGEGAELVELDEDTTQALPTEEGACDADEGTIDYLDLLAGEVGWHVGLVDEDVGVLRLEKGAEVMELAVGNDEILVATAGG